MTRLFDTAGHLSASPAGCRPAILARRGHASASERPLPRPWCAQLAGAENSFPAARKGCRAHSTRGRTGARCEPLVERGPLAARPPALSATIPALHGEVGGLLVPAGDAHPWGRRVPGAPRRARRRGDRDSRRARPSRTRDRHVPRGHEEAEGASQEVRGAVALRRGEDRARGGSAARARGNRRDRAPRAAGAAPCRLRRSDRGRRPRRAAARRTGADRDRASPGRDRRAGGLARVRPLLAFEGYQSGREFDAELLEQLDLLPSLVESTGFACAKAPGYEADDFLGAAVTQDEAADGSVLVATSDRDAFQLASERTTILQPARGGVPVRVGPDEVRERYGVEPSQVPDFIALRGDPSDRIPGARGVGPKKAAELLAQYGSLEKLLAEGRFSAEAEALRLYLRIATLDRSAPLPPLPDVAPDWVAAAAYARELGLAGVASRFEEAASWR